MSLFPPNFQRDPSFWFGPKGPGTPGAEALRGRRCSVIGNLSLFCFQLGQYECGMEGMPKLGCGTMPHVSCDPPGRGSRGMRFLRCRGHALTMTRRIGKLPNSLDGFQRRTVLSGSPWSNFFYDRQVPFHRHSCRPVTGSRLGVDYIKRHGSGLPQWVSVNFSCLCSSLDIPFSLCRFKHRLLLLQDHSKWGTDAVRPSFPNSCPGRWLLKGRPTGHRRTNLTACAMRVFPRSQVKYLSPRFQRSAHKESITGFIYHNILNMSR